MIEVPMAIPEHGDIMDSGVDSRGRLFIEVYDEDLSGVRRFYEDARTTARREKDRQKAQSN